MCSPAPYEEKLGKFSSDKKIYFVLSRLGSTQTDLATRRKFWIFIVV